MNLATHGIAHLEEPIHFYNGEATLRFDRENWRWYLVRKDGALEPVSGVTGVCGIIDKSMYLMPWACKMMYLKILRTMPAAKGCVKPIAWAEFDALLQQAKSAHKERLEDAGDVGSAAHAWIEATIRNAITFNEGVVDKMNEMAPTDERSVQCGLAAFDWMQKHNVRWLCTEREVYSRKYGYAGTTDGLALVDSCSNPTCCAHLFLDELSLIDWKSSNALRLEYLFQTAAYQNAIVEETGETIDARWILRLDKDTGKFDPWYETDFDQDFEGYLACLSLQRIHRAVEKRMSGQKKLKTFKKREAVKEAKKRIHFEKRVPKKTTCEFDFGKEGDAQDVHSKQAMEK
ncbi:MAG: hypothetical protein WCC97_12210 [Candidatus Acidiferrales bacterium]